MGRLIAVSFNHCYKLGPPAPPAELIPGATTPLIGLCWDADAGTLGGIPGPVWGAPLLGIPGGAGLFDDGWCTVAVPEGPTPVIPPPPEATLPDEDEVGNDGRSSNLS